jgi:hypothetical protein
MATLRFAQRPAQTSYVQVPMKDLAPPSSSSTPDPKNDPDPAKKEGGEVPKAEESAKWDPSKQPFNPFDVSLGSTTPPKEISGHIEPGPMTAAPKPGEAKPAPRVDPQETPTPKGLLVAMRLAISDPEAAVKALQGIASKVGGAAIQFDEMASKPDPEGAIVFVPGDKYDEVAKLIESVGSIVVSDRWTGSSLDRIDRIERSAQDRLSDLRIQRQELLIKYFEDAPQVKHVDEDSARISKCVAAVRARKPGPNVAVIKIKFLT